MKGSSRGAHAPAKSDAAATEIAVSEERDTRIASALEEGRRELEAGNEDAAIAKANEVLALEEGSEEGRKLRDEALAARVAKLQAERVQKYNGLSAAIDGAMEKGEWDEAMAAIAELEYLAKLGAGASRMGEVKTCEAGKLVDEAARHIGAGELDEAVMKLDRARAHTPADSVARRVNALRDEVKLKEEAKYPLLLEVVVEDAPIEEGGQVVWTEEKGEILCATEGSEGRHRVRRCPGWARGQRVNEDEGWIGADHVRALPEARQRWAGLRPGGEYPVAMCWTRDVPEAIDIDGVPHILYKRSADTPLSRLKIAIRASYSPSFGGEAKVLMADIGPEVDVTPPKGLIYSGPWSFLGRMGLTMLAQLQGSGTLHVALFESAPEGAAGEQKRGRQVSNWIGIPVNLSSLKAPSLF